MMNRMIRTMAAVLVFSTLFASAAFAQGWNQMDRKWYYWQADGTVAKNQWIPGEDGITRYYVGHDGAMATNSWIPEGENWRYVNGDGVEVKNTLLELDSKTKKYYIDEQGNMLTNAWKEVETEEGKKIWYYFGNDGAACKNGVFSIDGDYYYFTKSGRMAQDVSTPAGYAGADGKLPK